MYVRYFLLVLFSLCLPASAQFPGTVGIGFFQKPDVVPNPIDFVNFNFQSSVETFSGISVPIAITITANNGTGSPGFYYSINSMPWVNVPVGTPATGLTINAGDTLQLMVVGTHTDDGSFSVTNDLDSGNSIDTSIGTVMIGASGPSGLIYAGEFDGEYYMVTPGNCTNSATPLCDGGIDSLSKEWNGSGTSTVDIVGVENIGTNATSSSLATKGDVATAAIVAEGSITADSAAHYCSNMDYGGETDWYLPNKSELAHIYCLAIVDTGHSHNVAYPDEDINCASLGGKQSLIQGFANQFYWSSNESSGTQAFRHAFQNGAQSALGKDNSYRVRCVRRFN